MTYFIVLLNHVGHIKNDSAAQISFDSAKLLPMALNSRHWVLLSFGCMKIKANFSNFLSPSSFYNLPCNSRTLFFQESVSDPKLFCQIFSKDVRLPVQLQRAMAAEAEAAREARAKVKQNLMSL